MANHLSTETTTQHTCFGRIFCGASKVVARRECPACTPEDVAAAEADAAANVPSFLKGRA